MPQGHKPPETARIKMSNPTIDKMNQPSKSLPACFWAIDELDMRCSLCGSGERVERLCVGSCEIGVCHFHRLIYCSDKDLLEAWRRDVGPWQERFERISGYTEVAFYAPLSDDVPPEILEIINATYAAQPDQVLLRALQRAIDAAGDLASLARTPEYLELIVIPSVSPAKVREQAQKLETIATATATYLKTLVGADREVYAAVRGF
jgi:hypothetical protein